MRPGVTAGGDRFRVWWRGREREGPEGRAAASESMVVDLRRWGHIKSDDGSHKENSHAPAGSRVKLNKCGDSPWVAKEYCVSWGTKLRQRSWGKLKSTSWGRFQKPDFAASTSTSTSQNFLIRKLEGWSWGRVEAISNRSWGRVEAWVGVELEVFEPP